MKTGAVLFLLILISSGVCSEVHAGTYKFLPIDYEASSETLAFDINESKVIVGYYEDATGKHGLLYDGMEYNSLDYPGATDTWARGLNDSGDIVGRYHDSSRWHGFFYDGSSYVKIDYPGAIETRAIDVNNSQHIVGYYAKDAVSWTGFLYDGPVTEIDPTQFKSIEYPGALYTNALGINSDGFIVGRYQAYDGWHGFIYYEGTYTRVDYPGTTAGDTSCFGINDAGHIVGRYNDSGRWYGCLYSGPLELIDPDKFTSIEAPHVFHTNTWGINNLGDIVGYWQETVDAKFRGFIAKLESEVDKLQNLKTAINDSHPDCYKNNPVLRKTALINKIDAIIKSIAVADMETDPTVQDELYDEAINKLCNDIRAKMDSCSGGLAKNDWIEDCDTQVLLSDQIDEITAMIIDLKNNN